MRCRKAELCSQYGKMCRVETGLGSLVQSQLTTMAALFIPLEAEQEEQKAVFHGSFSSPASLRLRQRPLPIPLEKQWNWIQFPSLATNTLSSGSLLISFILWIMREEAESEFWKLPHPLWSPGEHGNTSHFAQLPFVVGCLIFHLSFASLVCCWASGSAISKSFPRMKEKFTYTLFCVLIPFPRNLPSKPKGLGKIFRE